MSEIRTSISTIKINKEDRLRVLSQDQLDKLHQATLTVLQQTGVKFPSTKALQIFSDHGAQVDFEDQIVKLSPDMVEEALDKAPRTYTLGSRTDPSLDIILDEESTYFTTDGTGVRIIDWNSREKRSTTAEDLGNFALIADYLSPISIYWTSVSPQDTPSSVRDLYELKVSALNTVKHIQPNISGELRAKYYVELASVIAGGKKELRKRPPVSSLICCIDPLAQDKEGVEAALVSAEAGIPVGFMAMPTTCTTAPSTLAGTLVVGNAEVLSALVMVQLAHPSAPVFYSNLPGMLNPYTGGYVAGLALERLLTPATVQLAHYYNFPVLSAGFGDSDAHRPTDYETGLEFLTAFPAVFAGADIVSGLGLLEASTLLYPEKILFDNEIFNTVKTFSQGIEVNQSTLALDEIMEVGPRGQFLTQPSTKDNLRKLWNPGITHQWSKEEGDFKDPQQVAIEKIEWILDNHKPKPLSKHKREELDRIIETAEDELSS